MNISTMTLSAGSAVDRPTPRLSALKSPNTRPLDDGFANVPWNITDVAKDIIDRFKGDISRNMVISRLVVKGLAQECPQVAAELAAELRKAGRLLCFAFCLFTVLTADEMRRPSRRSSRRDEVSQWEVV